MIQPVLEAEEMFVATALTGDAAPTIRTGRPQAARTLALMHGPADAGGCHQALLDLPDADEDRLTATLELARTGVP